MIASLPMYDRPETRGPYDRLWARIRDELKLLWADRPETGYPLPEALTHNGDPWDHWQDPDLVLSQTCGLPYRSVLHPNVTLIGTPDYGLAGCPPGYYHSVFIARDPDATLADLAGHRFAYNEALSQ